MLYDEMVKGTKGLATYSEYEAINALYMASDMSKEDAYKLWKKVYGNNHKPIAVETREDMRNLWNMIYNSSSREKMVFDKVAEKTYTLVIDGSTPNRCYEYLQLAEQHFNVKAGKIEMTSLDFIETGYGRGRFHSRYEDIVKVLN